MASTPEAITDELPELYEAFKRLHLVPLWAWHEHANDTREDAILFSAQDTSILQAFGLYREQAYEANAGHQTITRAFRP
jgi:gentisate 1,2-dioxygenase